MVLSGHREEWKGSGWWQASRARASFYFCWDTGGSAGETPLSWTRRSRVLPRVRTCMTTEADLKSINRIQPDGDTAKDCG